MLEFQAAETEATVRQGYLRNCLLPSGLGTQPQQPSRLRHIRRAKQQPELPNPASQVQAQQDSLADVLQKLASGTVVTYLPSPAVN